MGSSTHDLNAPQAHDRVMLLTEFNGSASIVIEADADDVFGAITAFERLSDWNARVAKVLEPPSDPSLAEGTEWVVKMAVPPGARWPSRSRVVVCDRDRGIFEYVSCSDDGNP